jgi:hypothetical protein
MAAYEDFQFFRTTRGRAASAAVAEPPAGDALSPPARRRSTAPDALRAELERLSSELRRLRARQRVRRRARWPTRLRRLVRCLLPSARGAA